MSKGLAIELLEKSHERASFDCGVEPLNAYIRLYTMQNQKRNIVRNYVIAPENKVAAYYSLSFGSVSPENMPIEMRSGNYLLPIMLIGRLAVDSDHKGKGFGHAMVQDAAPRAIHAAEIAGLKALFVHAKGDDAKAFSRFYVLPR